MRKKVKQPKPHRYSKLENEIWHARTRAKERFGLELSVGDIRKIGKLIQEGKGQKLEKKTCTKYLYRVSYMDTSMLIIYDRRRGVPVTMYPENGKYD